MFDQVGLEGIARAAYDADAMSIGPPYSAVFDKVFVGLSLPARTRADAAWGPTSGERYEGRLMLFGFGGVGAVRVDALWRGAIVASAASPLAHIDRVLTSWPDPGGIDDEIVRSLGSLPGDPARLEAERRARLLARLRAGFRQPDALTDAVLDGWLASIGARSVGDLVERFANQLLGGTLQVGFSAGATTTAPRALPLSAAILVRDQPIHVADLLAQSKAVADQLEDLGVERAQGGDSARAQPVVVVWMVPEQVFDDAGWPGGESATTDVARRALRRQAAGRWLAREGIGLVTTAAVPG
ncbi:MAG: hypothetical protein E6J90_50495 [Deltaproteobacteria bacterium]|nr:MAG: hypothetical protein E6J90_50495 [Deltaproteobacteria bacterium]TMQ07456.1 MAG: hypothetical protein E6J91_35480 [Deltaproteobacteria bacterium]